jgi:hypothetical protein
VILLWAASVKKTLTTHHRSLSSCHPVTSLAGAVKMRGFAVDDADAKAC